MLLQNRGKSTKKIWNIHKVRQIILIFAQKIVILQARFENSKYYETHFRIQQPPQAGRSTQNPISPNRSGGVVRYWFSARNR